jgi:beta-lactam-binding protein with PASTA domain
VADLRAAARILDPARLLRGLREALRSPGRTLRLAVAFAAAGLLLGYAFSALVWFPAGGVPRDLVRVPDLRGTDLADADARARQVGLALAVVDSLHHPTAARGRVLAQDPLPRQFARPGDTVRVAASLGRGSRPVPDVVGLRQAQAAVVLRQAGFEPVLQWVDGEADVGQVVDTRPEPGRRLELPAQVAVLVSAGPRIAVVPDLVTRSLAEAETTLARLGLRLGTVVPDTSADAAPGTVLAQNPVPGTSVPRGTPVAVSVAGARAPAADTAAADTAASADTASAAGAGAAPAPGDARRDVGPVRAGREPEVR